MKKWIVALLLCSAVWAGAQAPDMSPPKEMKDMAWYVGEWTGEMKLYMPGSNDAMSAKGTMKVSMALGGRFVRAEHTYDMPGMGQMTGLDLTTYNPATKEWHTHWFDSMSVSPMHFVGKREGDKTVAICKGYEMEGMGKTDYRATYSRVSDSKTTFVLEMKMGDSWSKLMEATYTKK